MTGAGVPEPSRPIRLLAVVHRSTVGGTEVCFERVLGALASDPAFEVCAAYPRDGEMVERWDALAPHIPYEVGTLPDRFDLRAYKGWIRRRQLHFDDFEADVTAFAPDVIVSFTSVLIAPIDIAARLGVPAVAYVREFVHPSLVRRWLWAHLAKRAGRLIAVSTPVAEALEPYARGRVRLVHDGVPLPAQTDPSAWPPAAPLAGFYGGYDPRKGGELFVRMAAKVRETVPDARFAFHGVATGGQHAFSGSLKALATELGLMSSDGPGAALTFVETQDFASSFERNTVVVMPSVREGLGLVAIDAMSHGVPVVASQTGGLPDVVDDGATGRLVLVGDTAGFAGAVSAIMLDPTAAAEMGAAARARVEHLFTVDKAVDGLRDAVREVVAGRSR